MIPRLWTCTSHPVLSVLSFPLSLGCILFLCMLAGLLRRYGDPVLALRCRYFARALALCYAVGVLTVTVAGGAVVLIGGHGNSIFVAARYVWPVLSCLGIYLGHAFATRALTRQGVGGKLRRTSAVPLSTWAAGIALAIYIPHLFVTREPHLWALPYQGAELAFDLATTNLASDECLAFRTVDDVQTAFGRPPPGDAAFLALDRHGIDAVPGISAFLKDQMSDGWPGSPSIVGLLATVARHGDFPILQVYQSALVYEANLMRDCIHQGRKVRRTSRGSYRCELLGQRRPRYE